MSLFRKKEFTFPSAEEAEAVRVEKVKENQAIYLDTLKKETAPLIRKSALLAESSTSIYYFRDTYTKGSNLYNRDRLPVIKEFAEYLRSQGFKVTDRSGCDPLYEYLTVSWEKKND